MSANGDAISEILTAIMDVREVEGGWASGGGARVGVLAGPYKAQILIEPPVVVQLAYFADLCAVNEDLCVDPLAAAGQPASDSGLTRR